MIPKMRKLRNYFVDTLAVLSALLGAETGYGASYQYYLPYFSQEAGYWTGVALSNSSISQSANVTVSIYGTSGEEGGAVTMEILPRGQEAFLLTSQRVERGWVMVCSEQPLTGFVFFGTQSMIADVSLEKTLATTLHVPHVAQNEYWDTWVFVCNPHATATNVTLSFFTGTGHQENVGRYQVPAWGRVDVALADVRPGAATSGGKVEISASQPIAGFALFTNAKVGGYGYAGISAVDPGMGGSPPPCLVEIYPDSSCARIAIGAPFSTVRALYGTPSTTTPSTSEWVNYFWYDDLGISGAVEDSDRDEVLDNGEVVFTVIVTSPYGGTTVQCNGIGSSRTSVLSEFGACDYNEYSYEWGGTLELYDEGIGFIYDAQNQVLGVAVYDADISAHAQLDAQGQGFALRAGVMKDLH